MEPPASQLLDRVIPINGKPARLPMNTGYTAGNESKDHFVQRNGIEFAGAQIIAV